MNHHPDSPESLVKDSHLVLDRFGLWPSFHDAEVRAMNLDVIGPTLTIDIFAFTMDTTVEAGYYRQLHQSIVTLRFEHIEELEIDDWNHQNTLTGLSILRHDPDRIAVAVSGSFGVSAHWLCRGARVMAVTPVEQ
jgi:hypothetical protein